MITELPTQRSVAESYNPSLLVLYGKPKSGKSSIMASLEDNLILDCEDGYRALPVMKVQVRTAKDYFDVQKLLAKKMQETGKKPYRFITIDNATRLEEQALSYAAMNYRATSMGAMWGLLKDKDGALLKKDGKFIPDPKADVRTLPQGGGYLYLREAIKTLVNMFKPYCETLILVCHVKDKQVRKDGKELSELSVDLAGKTGDIICGEADAIGLIYREGNKTIISFENGQDDTLKEARPLHLRGKKFVVAESDENNELHIDTSKIFLEPSERTDN